jgi:hypothetical protein
VGSSLRALPEVAAALALGRAPTEREPGDLGFGRRSTAGPHREGEEPEPVMHEPKKSDPAIRAMKPSNKAGSDAAAETAEQTAGTEGNAIQQSTHRTQMRARVSQAPERVRHAAKVRKKERFTALLHRVNPDLL